MRVDCPDREFARKCMDELEWNQLREVHSLMYQRVPWAT